MYKRKHDEICKGPLKNDTFNDHNKIVEQIVLKYVFITIKLVMQTIVYTWFLGCLIYVWCELTRNLDRESGTETLLTNPSNNENWGVTIDSMTPS
jgi:hypothetical protein